MKGLLTGALALAVLMPTAPAQADAPMRLTFDNQSNFKVESLLIRIAGSKTWGADRPGGKGLAAHTKTKFLIEDAADKCVLEIGFKASNGLQYHSVNRLCSNPTFVFYGH